MEAVEEGYYTTGGPSYIALTEGWGQTSKRCLALFDMEYQYTVWLNAPLGKFEILFSPVTRYPQLMREPMPSKRCLLN